MKQLWILMAVALVLLLSVSTAQSRAWEERQFGAQISLADEVDLGVGVRAGFALDQYLEKLEGVATFDFFFPGDNVTYWTINANALYSLDLNGDSSVGGNLMPYAGGGLGLAHWSYDRNGYGDYSDTKINLNLVAGTRFGGQRSVIPFAELRLPAGGFSGIDFFLTGGVWF